MNLAYVGLVMVVLVLVGRAKKIRFCTLCSLAASKRDLGCKPECAETLQSTLDRLDKCNRHVGSSTYAWLLRSCGGLRDLLAGRRVHAHILRSGFHSDRFLGNLLVEMYGKCGSVANARAVFDKMLNRNVFSWNLMISAYVDNEQPREALELFQRMDLQPTDVTFTSLLSACSDAGALAEGRAIHALVVSAGFESEVIVGTALVNMYGKCGQVEEARKMFDRMPERNVISWNAMITAYAQQGHYREALCLFRMMDCEGIQPTGITFVNAICACSNLGALAEGRAVHERAIRRGFQLDAIVGGSLVDMYCKCKSLEEARNVFDSIRDKDVVIWNVMIATYAQHGHSMEALKLYHEKMRPAGVKPSAITFINLLDACSNLLNLARGKQVHESLLANGFKADGVHGNSLINMYGRCRSLVDARAVFDNMSQKDVVSWNSMIGAYLQNCHAREALELFRGMDLSTVKPDKVTFIGLVDACASLGSLKDGKQVHSHAVASGLELDGNLGTSLVHMYGKCGSLQLAREVFDKMRWEDVVSWSALIAAYAHHGHVKEVLALLSLMDLEGIRPNNVTFVGILSACSHVGKLQKGWFCFTCLAFDHDVTLTVEHYSCMVDLLGRCGCLDDAEELINSMPFEAGSMEWMSLLGACKTHGDMKRGVRAAENVFELDPGNGAAYLLLSNMYSETGRWNDVERIRRIRDAGRSTIQI